MRHDIRTLAGIVVDGARALLRRVHQHWVGLMGMVLVRVGEGVVVVLRLVRERVGM